MVILCNFLLILENFCINRKLNFKKVSLYKPPLTPFWPCPARQEGIFLSFHLRGKTNRQMLCNKGGRNGDKNWWKHVRARYFPKNVLYVPVQYKSLIDKVLFVLRYMYVVQYIVGKWRGRTSCSETALRPSSDIRKSTT